MDSPGEVLRSLQFAFDNRLVDDRFRHDINEVTSLLGLHLLSHRFEIYAACDPHYPEGDSWPLRFVVVGLVVRYRDVTTSRQGSTRGSPPAP